MSARSASRRTEHRNGFETREPDPASVEPGLEAGELERLIGVRSSRPTFYAAWRENSARLDRTIETLERISAALCATLDGPGAVCEAVVEAAGHHFNALWAAMTFCGDLAAHGLPQVIMATGGHAAREWDEPPQILAALAARTLDAGGPVVIEAGDRSDPSSGRVGGGTVAAPMPLRGEFVGVLAVGLPADAEVEASGVSILVTLANHAGVALHNAWSFQESERLRVRWESMSRVAQRRASELERRSSELEGIRRRLEQAGRRQLLSQERNRIARELHDSVAQQLLTIGMNLEWCRRQESTSLPVLERVLAAQALARSAVDEIRAAIFELASDGQIELRRALGEVIDDVEAGTRLEVSLRTYGQAQPLPAAIAHALVQIAREALFNVVRHASAEHAWLMLRWRPANVLVVVSDDGTGRPDELQRYLLQPLPSAQHLGLAGIGERIRGLGGSACFTRRRGGGVKLKVEVPLGGTVGVA